MAELQKLVDLTGTVELGYIKTLPTAITPTRSTPGSVGLDVYSPTTYVLPPGGRAIIDIGIQFQIPPGHYGRLASRSGLALKHFITIEGGVIDPDYQGNILVIMFNHSLRQYTVEKGHRVAQFILERASIPTLKPIQHFTVPSIRGTKGLGSSVNPVWRPINYAITAPGVPTVYLEHIKLY